MIPFILSVATLSERDFIYTDPIDKKTLAPHYEEIVENMPICCVDIFLYDPAHHSYFLVLRNQAPAKGIWWFPGGRMFKGETFYECAARKCKEEIGLEIIPLKQIGSFSTIFPDSAFGCQTHTVNTVVIALVNSASSPQLDQNHEEFQWRDLSIPPDDPYLEQAYKEALIFLNPCESKK